LHAFHARGRGGRAVGDRRRDRQRLGSRPPGLPQLRGRNVGHVLGRRADQARPARLAAAMTDAAVEGWQGVDVKIAEVERELSRLRSVEEGRPYLRTSVLTHIAWLPPEWEQTGFDTLSGLAERHPSRAILLVPVVDAEDGIDADVTLRYFSWP